MFYVISQIIVIVRYCLLAITYQLKKRKSILLFSFASSIANAIVFILLSAWSGFAMSCVSIVRSIAFLIKNNKDTNEKFTKIDLWILISLYIISIVLAFFTYEGVLSLLSVGATMLYTYSICQKNSKMYKIIGIPVSILWISYNIFVKSLFGAILESIVLIFEIRGVTKESKNHKEKESLL